jgi:cytochrome c oxidase assembly factor CtaG
MTWKFNLVGAVAIAVAATLYGAGIILARRAGVRWPLLPTLGFFLLGLGSFAAIEFGFLGEYSAELRWAFTTRIALLLFVVPALITTGKPVALARIALSGMPLNVIERVLGSRLFTVMGTAIFAPLFALGAFSIFLTPLAGLLRESPFAQGSLTVLVPLVGLIMVLPLTETTRQVTTFFIAAEFLLAFVELVVDAIPGILLRLNDGVLDHAPSVVGSFPSWFPSPLHDQHLSGDLLWFIAELADIPVLILLFVRWSKIDRKEAAQIDELSDEEMDALTQEHLRTRQF